MRKRTKKAIGTVVGAGVFGAIVGGILYLAANDSPRPAATRPLTALDLFLQAVATAAAIMGVPTPPVVVTSNRNASAGFGAIFVDPVWLELEFLAPFCGDDACRWAALLGLGGHELHHLIYEDPMSTPQIEYRADEGAGYILGLARVPSEVFERIIGFLNAICNPTHGCPGARQQCIRKGFVRGVREALRRAIMRARRVA